MADQDRNRGVQLREGRPLGYGERGGAGGEMGASYDPGTFGGDDFGRGGSSDRSDTYGRHAGLHGPSGADYGGGGFERGALHGGFGPASARPHRGWWEVGHPAREGGSLHREEGPHRGRGPKGYQRSDERIREDVNDQLTDDPQLDASDIEVSVSGREVTLNGTVDSRSAKRRAEDIAESVSGVTHLQNNLRVKEHDMASRLQAADFSATTGYRRRD